MKQGTLSLIIIIAVLFPIACFGQAQARGVASFEPVPAAVTPMLNPGDAVQISVWRRPELSGEFHVAMDGSIAHPFYQGVNVGGLSPEAAATRIKVFLEGYETSPQVRIDPLFRVSVGGEVRQPRLYTLRPEYTISEAIDMAGGPTERGRLGGVRLYRDGTEHRLDLQGADATAAAMRIQSGDRIVVEANRSVFRDVIRPTVTILGSVASIAHVIIRVSR